MIHRVRVVRIRPDMSTEQVFVFRVAGKQDDAEAIGHMFQTRWMEQNPGHPTAMVLDWPRPEELGDEHSLPPMPTYFTWS